jgi:transposase
MEVLYPRCAGLDVHKATVVAAVRLVAVGRVAREVRTFATTTAGLLELAAWLAENGCTRVGMEATGVYWRPVWHILAEQGFDLVLANAAQVKNVPGRKTDVGDAAWLAELLAHGLVRASFVPDGPTQELRSLLRTREQLAREKASHTLRLQKTLEDANVKLDGVVADLLGRSGRAMLEALAAGEGDLPRGWRRSPIPGSARRRSGSGRRRGVGRRATTASCCGRTWTRSTRWRRRSPGSTARSRSTSPPFAPRPSC